MDGWVGIDPDGPEPIYLIEDHRIGPDAQQAIMERFPWRRSGKFSTAIIHHPQLAPLPAGGLIARSKCCASALILHGNHVQRAVYWQSYGARQHKPVVTA